MPKAEAVGHTERVIVVDDLPMVQVLGPVDRVIASVEARYPDVTVHVRGNRITISGPTEGTEAASQVLGELLAAARAGLDLSEHDVRSSAKLAEQGASTADQAAAGRGSLGRRILASRGKQVRSMTLGQTEYVDAIDENTIVFGIGPAGSGKTYLAMAKAVQALQAKQVSRIILTRPAVEAGERLGFLPGSLEEKIDPYLRPLFDAIHEMLDPDAVPRLLANGTIEVAPLAFMRGRTLNDSFVILDEAQNTTPEQLKMFLTRLGFGSKMVVTGDVTQVDLPGGQSGLARIRQILGEVEDIPFVTLPADDVARHELVGRIVEAYDRATAHQAASPQGAARATTTPRKG